MGPNSGSPESFDSLKRKKSGYDKNTLDKACHMVLQNKLSLRAASHLYKIPFSTLRTRKIRKKIFVLYFILSKI
jgi:hypothetical protein